MALPQLRKLGISPELAYIYSPLANTLVRPRAGAILLGGTPGGFASGVASTSSESLPALNSYHVQIQKHSQIRRGPR